MCVRSKRSRTHFASWLMVLFNAGGSGSPSVIASLKYVTRLLMRSQASRISSLLLDTNFDDLVSQKDLGNCGVLTSDQFAKNMSPPVRLFSGEQASED